jgi:hypothetical protein
MARYGDWSMRVMLQDYSKPVTRESVRATYDWFEAQPGD